VLRSTVRVRHCQWHSFVHPAVLPQCIQFLDDDAGIAIDFHAAALELSSSSRTTMGMTMSLSLKWNIDCGEWSRTLVSQNEDFLRHGSSFGGGRRRSGFADVFGAGTGLFFKSPRNPCRSGFPGPRRCRFGFDVGRGIASQTIAALILGMTCVARYIIESDSMPSVQLHQRFPEIGILDGLSLSGPPTVRRPSLDPPFGESVDEIRLNRNRALPHRVP